MRFGLGFNPCCHGCCSVIIEAASPGSTGFLFQSLLSWMLLSNLKHSGRRWARTTVSILVVMDAAQ